MGAAMTDEQELAAWVGLGREMAAYAARRRVEDAAAVLREMWAEGRIVCRPIWGPPKTLKLEWFGVLLS